MQVVSVPDENVSFFTDALLKPLLSVIAMSSLSSALCTTAEY
jgi:hypothetical protein